MFGVVVCHYYRPGQPLSIKASVRLCLSLLKQCPEVSTIVLSDGSGERDLELEEYCISLDVTYMHYGSEVSFAQTYNLGASLLSEEWIALMASDVFVYNSTFKAFKDFIKGYRTLNIGCLIPFLTTSDVLAQAHTFEFLENTCRVPIMTINLNVIKKSVFDQIGGVPAQFSGAYNDIVMAIKLHNLGLEIFMVKGAQACHYGRMTINSGTSYKYKVDKETFKKEFPAYVNPQTDWGVRMDSLVRRDPFKFVSRFYEDNNPPEPGFLNGLMHIIRLRLIYRSQRIG